MHTVMDCIVGTKGDFEVKILLLNNNVK